jgi:alpha-tubulin suppressor-like RCC1 family protein
MPVEALRGVRVGSIAAFEYHSYAVADTGVLWAWGTETEYSGPLGHDSETACPLPKPIEALRGVKVDAVIAFHTHTIARADDGSVYSWGTSDVAEWGALALGTSVMDAGYQHVRTPQRVPGLRLACGL